MAGKKRYCKMLELQNDPALIEEYKNVHAPGAVWPEITQGLREVGINDMEIYIYGNRLFMIMETEEDFDHDSAMKILSRKPRQAEWENYVSQFQNASSDAAASEKWQIMECIYKLDNR